MFAVSIKPTGPVHIRPPECVCVFGCEQRPVQIRTYRRASCTVVAPSVGKVCISWTGFSFQPTKNDRPRQEENLGKPEINDNYFELEVFPSPCGFDSGWGGRGGFYGRRQNFLHRTNPTTAHPHTYTCIAAVRILCPV